MTVDPSAERIHELRLEIQSTEWQLEDSRLGIEGAEIYPVLCASLREAQEALLVELDARAEGI